MLCRQGGSKEVVRREGRKKKRKEPWGGVWGGGLEGRGLGGRAGAVAYMCVCSPTFSGDPGRSASAASASAAAPPPRQPCSPHFNSPPPRPPCTRTAPTPSYPTPQHTHTHGDAPPHSIPAPASPREGVSCGRLEGTPRPHRRAERRACGSHEPVSVARDAPPGAATRRYPPKCMCVAACAWGMRGEGRRTERGRDGGTEGWRERAREGEGWDHGREGERERGSEEARKEGVAM